MWFLNRIAEARIAEAIERGEFDDLPGAGKPLVLDNDASVPEELRAAYRLLKNAGYLPRELELRREIADVSQLVAATEDQAARVRGYKRIDYLVAQLQAIRGTPVDLRVEQAYYEKLLERLTGS